MPIASEKAESSTCPPRSLSTPLAPRPFKRQLSDTPPRGAVLRVFCTGGAVYWSARLAREKCTAVGRGL
eukprot:577218-Rhodomonas_salina.1